MTGADSLNADQPMPLSGVRVLEFGQAVSSPLCTMLLGDLGADVVKIEPPNGDPARGYGPPFVSGESPYYLSCNRNKRSTALNIKHEAGAAIVRTMCERADIIVTNFRPGVMDRLGIGYESLKTVNPGLIFCQVTGYGPDGPFASQPAYDQVAQGMSGLMSVTGTAESGPIRVGVAIGDVLAALHATVGVLGAWAHRQNTGEGQRVDTSLLGAILGILTYQTGSYLADGTEPQRVGNDHPVAAPYGAFSTKDGQINISIASETMWRRLAEVLGHPEWVDDPRFGSNAERVNNRSVIHALVTEALSTDTVSNWVARLNDAGVACGPIWTVGESLESEQVAHMGIVRQVEHDLAGQIKLIGPAIGMSQTPQVIRRSPPLLAQHTAEVLEELGIDAEEIGRLAADDAITLGPVTRGGQS